jgi:hypothetical protein
VNVYKNAIWGQWFSGRLCISIASFARMGRKSKLKRFAEVATFSNVFEHVPGNDFHVSNEEGQSRILKGQWAIDHFHNDHPLIL